MYGELAPWFHVLTAPEDYEEEAAFYVSQLKEALGHAPESVLELGAGGGNNAWHYKHTVRSVTLTDLSDRMLALSRKINPECEHVVGDMRTVRLGRQFEAVFVHDAVSYLTTEDDLRRCMETAFAHCLSGGAVLFAPDHVSENFVASTDCGGHDGEGRGLRYLEWAHDPDPNDCTYLVDYAFLLREDGQPVRTVHDQHTCGLFSRSTWLSLLQSVGFEGAKALPFNHSEVPPGTLEVFVARAP
jgi:SAM-dependent methyltransferase